MEDLIKQLNKLPTAKLSRKKNIGIRLALYSLIWRRYREYIISALTLKRLKLILPAGVVLVIIVISVPAYAYESSSVTRGHVLYNLKKGIERLEINMADTEEEKIEKYVKMANRRLLEAEVLSSRGQEAGNLVETISEAMENSLQAEISAENIMIGPGNGNLEKKFQNAKAAQEEVIAGIAQSVGINAEEEVLDSVATALSSVQVSESNGLNRGQAKKLLNSFPESEPADSANEDAEEADGDEETPANTATTAPIKSQGNSGQAQQGAITTESAQQSLDELKNRVGEMKENLPSAEYDETDVAVLFERLDKRIEKAEEFIQADKLNGLQGLINSTSAISNNARHFMKPKKENNSNNNSNKINNDAGGNSDKGK